MTKLASIVLGAGLAFASIGLAHADGTVAGAWKVTIGVNDAPCTLTLTTNDSATGGAIAPGSDCPGNLSSVTAWKLSGSSIQIYAGGGELVAWLKPQGDSYVGTRVEDGRKLALSR